MTPFPQLPPDRSLPRQRHAAARAQLQRYATSRRERVVQRWRGAAVAMGLGLGLAVAGGAAAGTVYLTRGPIPTVNGRLDVALAPDFIRVASSGLAVGYVPKRYILPSGPGTPANGLVGEIAPVYGPDLKTLVGHMYPGIGYVALGTSLRSVSCTPESDEENGTTSTLPCPSVTETVPDVAGMSTPEGVVALQEAGVLAVVENAHSRAVPGGHIVRTSPRAGARVPARTPVVVVNSLGP